MNQMFNEKIYDHCGTIKGTNKLLQQIKNSKYVIKTIKANMFIIIKKTKQMYLILFRCSSFLTKEMKEISSFIVLYGNRRICLHMTHVLFY